MRASLWLLTVLLVWTSLYVPLSSYAQTQPPTDSIRRQIRSATDTLAAVHQLFLSKRRSGKAAIWIGVGFGGACSLIGLGSYAAINSVKKTTSGKPLEEGAASVSLKFSLPALPIISLGLIRRIRFNQHRESVVVSAYEQGRGLLPSVQRSIRRQHFANQ